MERTLSYTSSIKGLPTLADFFSAGLFESVTLYWKRNACVVQAYSRTKTAMILATLPWSPQDMKKRTKMYGSIRILAEKFEKVIQCICRLQGKVTIRVDEQDVTFWSQRGNRRTVTTISRLEASGDVLMEPPLELYVHIPFLLFRKERNKQRKEQEQENEEEEEKKNPTLFREIQHFFDIQDGKLPVQITVKKENKDKLKMCDGQTKHRFHITTTFENGTMDLKSCFVYNDDETKPTKEIKIPFVAFQALIKSLAKIYKPFSDAQSVEYMIPQEGAHVPFGLNICFRPVSETQEWIRHTRKRRMRERDEDDDDEQLEEEQDVCISVYSACLHEET
jgi:hypothetical protein